MSNKTQNRVYQDTPILKRIDNRKIDRAKDKLSPSFDRPTTLEEGFNHFWQAYPRKKNKGKAEKAWQKIKPGPELLKTMLDAIKQAEKSEDWLKEGGQYIPHPASWLNAKGWEDEFGTTDQPEPDCEEMAE